VSDVEVTRPPEAVITPVAASIRLAEIAAAISSALWKRFSGSFSSALRTIASAEAGMMRCGATTLKGGADSNECWKMKPVSDSLRVGERERRAHLPRPLEGALDLGRAVVLEDPVDRAAVDEVHRVERELVGRRRVAHDHDVRVHEAHADLHLADERVAARDV